MIDTNQINQAVETFQVVHAQAVTNWPAISMAAVIVARELKNLNAWLLSAAEFVIKHGGIITLVGKLLYTKANEGNKGPAASLPSLPSVNPSQIPDPKS